MRMHFWRIPAALLLVSACGSRTAQSANVPDMEALSLTVLEPTMALEPEASAQDPVLVGDVEFDHTVHDFGDVSVTDGPLTCTFTLKNTGSEPIAIFEVVSSCGCTDVKWTREPIQSGKSGKISATYKNEDGPLPFDKTLTVYISGLKKPVILRLRGVVHEKKKALSELYGAERLGAFGLKTREYKVGNVRQGALVSERFQVANLGNKPLEVSFAGVSPQLTVSVSPNPIPAGSSATLLATVKADKELYGTNWYTATPVLNGKEAEGTLRFRAYTQENFDDWTADQRKDGSRPMFESSTSNFGTVDSGKTVEASFTYTNQGRSPLRIYRVDAESPAVEIVEVTEAQAGKKGHVRVRFHTDGVPAGETVIMLTLATNSPLRPIVNLFLAGIVR